MWLCQDHFWDFDFFWGLNSEPKSFQTSPKNILLRCDVKKGTNKIFCQLIFRVYQVKIQSHVVDIKIRFFVSIWPTESDRIFEVSNFSHIDHIWSKMATVRNSTHSRVKFSTSLVQWNGYNHNWITAGSASEFWTSYDLDWLSSWDAQPVLTHWKWVIA